MKTLKFAPILLTFFPLFLTKCKKADLDLSSNTYFGISEIFKSKNCDADCEETANCEGKTVKIRGVLDEYSINTAQHQFYLMDETKEKIRLEVKVEKTASLAVFKKIKDKGGQVLQLEGVLEGFDARTNLNCDRKFFLRLDDAFKIHHRE